MLVPAIFSKEIEYKAQAIFGTENKVNRDIFFNEAY